MIGIKIFGNKLRGPATNVGNTQKEPPAKKRNMQGMALCNDDKKVQG